jgi:hypothetical protein
VDVLEELEATVAVWRLEHRDVGVVSVEADGGVGPLSTNGVTSEKDQPEVGEEAIAASRSRTAMPTFSSLMRTRCTLPSQGDVFRSVSCQFRLSRTRNCPAAVPRADLPAGAQIGEKPPFPVRQPGAIRVAVVRSLLRLSDRAVEIRRGSAAGASPDEV